MKYFVSLLLCITFISCNNNEDAISNLKQTEADIIQYLEINNLNAQKTNSGVYYIIDEQGEGRKPAADAFVTITYKGYLLDGTVFDLSNDDGVILDLLAVIPGFAQGLTFFNEGGKGTILIPPSLAYGNSGASNIIPGGAVVVFDIEVLSVLNAQTEDDILEYLLENDLEAERTDSGVYYIVDELGEGAEITENSSVTVKYTATLTNGIEFDKSGDAGSNFNLQNVIPGFAEGISKFKKGGKGKLIIPPYLAYGSSGVQNVVPRNVIVIFDFEIL